MVESNPVTVSVQRIVHQMIIFASDWNVLPSTVTPANPDVTASVRVKYKPTGLPEVGVMNAPVIVHVTRPDGTTFDTLQAFTDSLGDASWIVTLDQTGIWTFVCEAFGFVTNGEEYLGTHKENQVEALEFPPVGIVELWNRLPWWQKAFIIAGGAVAVGGSVYAIAKRRS